MKRWIIIGSIGFLLSTILIAGLMLFLNRSNSEPVQVVEERDGWKTIEHPTYGIRISTPVEMSMTAMEEGVGRLIGELSGRGYDLNISLESTPSTVPVNVEELSLSVLPYRAQDISEGNLVGIAYAGRLPAPSDLSLRTNINEEYGYQPTGFIEQSYIVGKKLFLNGAIIEATCTIEGSNYVGQIKVCDQILTSLELGR